MVWIIISLLQFREIARARSSSWDEISCHSGFFFLTLSRTSHGKLRIFRWGDVWWAALIWESLMVPILYFQLMHEKILKHLIFKKGLLVWTFHMWCECIVWATFWQPTLLFLCSLVLSYIPLFHRLRGTDIKLLIAIFLRNQLIVLSVILI